MRQLRLSAIIGGRILHAPALSVLVPIQEDMRQVL
jgi:hypothetical protein